MNFHSIKRRWLRRVAMVAFGAPFVFQYIWLGLKAMFYEFRGCWNFEHPEA